MLYESERTKKSVLLITRSILKWPHSGKIDGVIYLY
jgi:hypothetical protein